MDWLGQNLPGFLFLILAFVCSASCGVVFADKIKSSFKNKFRVDSWPWFWIDHVVMNLFLLFYIDQAMGVLRIVWIICQWYHFKDFGPKTQPRQDTKKRLNAIHFVLYALWNVRVISSIIFTTTAYTHNLWPVACSEIELTFVAFFHFLGRPMNIMAKWPFVFFNWTCMYMTFTCKPCLAEYQVDALFDMYNQQNKWHVLESSEECMVRYVRIHKCHANIQSTNNACLNPGWKKWLHLLTVLTYALAVAVKTMYMPQSPFYGFTWNNPDYILAASCILGPLLLYGFLCAISKNLILIPLVVLVVCLCLEQTPLWGVVKCDNMESHVPVHYNFQTPDEMDCMLNDNTDELVECRDNTELKHTEISIHAIFKSFKQNQKQCRVYVKGSPIAFTTGNYAWMNSCVLHAKKTNKEDHKRLEDKAKLLKYQSILNQHGTHEQIVDKLTTLVTIEKVMSDYSIQNDNDLGKRLLDAKIVHDVLNSNGMGPGGLSLKLNELKVFESTYGTHEQIVDKLTTLVTIEKVMSDYSIQNDNDLGKRLLDAKIVHDVLNSNGMGPGDLKAELQKLVDLNAIEKSLVVMNVTKDDLISELSKCNTLKSKEAPHQIQYEHTREELVNCTKGLVMANAEIKHLKRKAEVECALFCNNIIETQRRQQVIPPGCDCKKLVPDAINRTECNLELVECNMTNQNLEQKNEQSAVRLINCNTLVSNERKQKEKCELDRQKELHESGQNCTLRHESLERDHYKEMDHETKHYHNKLKEHTWKFAILLFSVFCMLLLNSAAFAFTARRKKISKRHRHSMMVTLTDEEQDYIKAMRRWSSFHSSCSVTSLPDSPV